MKIVVVKDKLSLAFVTQRHDVLLLKLLSQFPVLLSSSVVNGISDHSRKPMITQHQVSNCRQYNCQSRAFLLS